jgi:hypothetical protein
MKSAEEKYTTQTFQARMKSLSLQETTLEYHII